MPVRKCVCVKGGVFLLVPASLPRPPNFRALRTEAQAQEVADPLRGAGKALAHQAGLVTAPASPSGCTALPLLPCLLQGWTSSPPPTQSLLSPCLPSLAEGRSVGGAQCAWSVCSGDASPAVEGSQDRGLLGPHHTP